MIILNMAKPLYIKKYDKIKILMLGDSAVGKSTLVNILRGKTNNKYAPTIFDNIYHYLEIDEDYYQLDIRDTSGAPEYSNLITTHLNNVDLVLICYAVDNRTSFYNIGSYWKEKVKDVPLMLLGLKIDLRYQQTLDSEIEIISYEEGKKLSTQLRAGYQEFCQTKDEKQQKENIEEIFSRAVKYTLAEKQKKSNTEYKSHKSCVVC